MSPQQKKALINANKLLKAAWPKDNLQISFNLAKTHNNVNYNTKQSGIIPPNEQA